MCMVATKSITGKSYLKNITQQLYLKNINKVEYSNIIYLFIIAPSVITISKGCGYDSVKVVDRPIYT